MKTPPTSPPSLAQNVWVHLGVAGTLGIILGIVLDRTLLAKKPGSSAAPSGLPGSTTRPGGALDYNGKFTAGGKRSSHGPDPIHTIEPQQPISTAGPYGVGENSPTTRQPNAIHGPIEIPGVRMLQIRNAEWGSVFYYNGDRIQDLNWDDNSRAYTLAVLYPAPPNAIISIVSPRGEFIGDFWAGVPFIDLGARLAPAAPNKNNPLAAVRPSKQYKRGA